MSLAFVLREDDQLAEPVRQRWLMAGQRAARFLDELRFKPANRFYVRNLATARGGLRHSLYDNEMLPSACAMGLLSIDPFRRAVRAMEAEQAVLPAMPEPATVY